MMAWDITRYKVKLQLSEPMLGTVPTQSSIWANHIATKQAKALKREGWAEADIKKELESTIEGVADNDDLQVGLTGFFNDGDGYFLRDYQVKGFLKEAAKVMKQFGATKQLRSKVVQSLFVRPRKVYVAKPNADLEIVERPLRGQTPQGERIAIARSFSVPAGTKLEFEIHTLNGVITKGCVEALLEYGQYQGFGQWRGAGNGSFEVLQLLQL